MKPTTRKPASLRRQEIAEAVLRIIGERGVTSLTAAVLAAEVGLTSGALYRHFASLDKILEAAVEMAVERVDATFPAADLPPAERLRRLTLGRIELIRSRPGLGWLLLSDQVYLTVPEPAIARLRDLVRRSRAYLLRALREGADDGSLRSDLPAEALLVVLTGTIHTLARTSGVHGTPPGHPPSTNPKRILDALFTLLAPPSAASLAIDTSSSRSSGVKP